MCRFPEYPSVPCPESGGEYQEWYPAWSEPEGRYYSLNRWDSVPHPQNVLRGNLPLPAWIFGYWFPWRHPGWQPSYVTGLSGNQGVLFWMLCSYGAENLPSVRHWNKDNCRHVFPVLLRGNGRNLFSREWKRYGNDLRKVKTPVKILCFIPDFLEGWEISIFLFHFRMSLSCFTLFPGKRMRGLEKKEEELWIKR